MTQPCNSSSSSGSRASMRPSGMSRRRQRALGELVQWTMPARGAPSRPRRHTKPAPYRVSMLLGCCFPPSTSMNPCTLAGAAAAGPQAETARRDAASAAEWRQSAYSSDCLNNNCFCHRTLIVCGVDVRILVFRSGDIPRSPQTGHDRVAQTRCYTKRRSASTKLVHSDGIQLQEPRIHKSVHGPGISCICRVYPARRDVR